MDGAADRYEGYCGGSPCEAPVMSAVGVLAGRWSVAVIESVHFAGGAARFRELQRRIDGISAKELTRQLVQLVAQGVLARAGQDADADEACAARPAGYVLTDRGRRLLRHMEALGEWAKENGGFESGTCEKATWFDPLRRCPTGQWKAR